MAFTTVALVLCALLTDDVVGASFSGGCALNLSNNRDDMEPSGNPLEILVRKQILHIRDVPDSGGSFGVDLKYVRWLPLMMSMIILDL